MVVDGKMPTINPLPEIPWDWKCETCGKQHISSIPPWVDIKTQKFVTCDYCGGSLIKMSNQEWYNSLPKKLADFIFGSSYSNVMENK